MKKNHRFTVPMEDTFNRLDKRLIDANYMVDDCNLDILNELKGTTITIGCGGSLVVANYLSKVLANKGIFSITKNARDILHERILSNNLIGFSYSGKTHGIHLALDNFFGNKYLITCNSNIERQDANIIYLGHESMDKEKSFISLSSTLIPMGEFLKFSEKLDKRTFSDFLDEMLNISKRCDFYNNIDDFSKDLGSNEVFEIMSGSDTSTAALFLESTLTEAGLGVPVIHDKYSYCHGRSTLAYKNNKKHHLVYLINDKAEIDDFLLPLIKNNYYNVTIIEANSKDMTLLEKEYFLTLKCIFFCKKLADVKSLDLSQVEYDQDIVNKVYKYKGEM